MDIQPDQTSFEGIVTAMTQCGYCNKVIPLTEATISTHIITAHYTDVEHYCSDKCAMTEWRNR